MNSDQELPSGMISEILSRTTLETLDTCKAVSKEWKELIYESSFMPLYFERTGNLFGYFVQDIKSHKYVSMFVSNDQSEGSRINGSWPCDDMRILASCNQGILCCERSKDKNYRWYMSKPATQQWQAMPNPKLRYRTVGVVIVVFKSKPLQYKFVRISELMINVEKMMEYFCEIFDSKTWAWRETQGVNLSYDEFIITQPPAISIGEFVYWQTDKDNVLAFDVAQEHFQKFSLPESVWNNDAYKYKRLVEYEGGLGFTCVEEYKNMQLWLTKGSRNYEWKRKMAVDINILGKPVGFFNSGIAFMWADFGAVFYKLEDRSFTAVKVGYAFKDADEVFQFRSDVECVDLRGGE